MHSILAPDNFVELHSGALTILVLVALVLGTLLVLVPQLLRSHQRIMEMQHTERMRALEQGLPPAPIDERSLATGRVALIVPTVVMCAAATVTCFLVTYGSEHVFAVAVVVWSVGG